MIKIKLRKAKIILVGLPENVPATYEREALRFEDAGVGQDGLPQLSIYNLDEERYLVSRRRISEIIDEQGQAMQADASGSVAGQLNTLTTGTSDLPEGGAPGQVLIKRSSDDFDAEWKTINNWKQTEW